MRDETNMTGPQPQPGIELRSVGVRRGQEWILQDINWSVPAGACVAILGPNGSGKSTLARVLAGYIWPTAGEVFVDGRHFGETDLNDLRHGIRLVQPAGPYDADPELTAAEVVMTGLFGTIGLFDEVCQEQIQQAHHLLAKVGLGPVADHRYATLSSGERMRALIARALIHKPRLLLLDEPTAGLDLLAREQVLATVQTLSGTAEAPTIVLITHHVEELGPATSDVLILDEGRVGAIGPPAEVFTEQILTKVYKCPLKVRSEGSRHYVSVDARAWKTLLDD